MNNKSTENLLVSGESIEELHIPPLDLKQLNDDKKQKSENSDSDHSLKNKPKRVQNNFLVEESQISNESEAKPAGNQPPVPAVRKLSLPPIASKRNGKDKKENSNKLTRNQHNPSNDTIRIVSERPQAQQARNNKAARSNDSESDSDRCQLKHQSINENANKIELKAFAAQTKNNLKSTFSVAEINEETTSFISYEEKHEKEDNSERTSNHSSVNSKGLPKNDDNDGGVENEAFVQDPDDDHVEVQKPPEIDNKSKFKKKEKKPKAIKKTKEKRSKKRSSKHTEDTIEQAVANDESDDDIQNTYDFKKVIGKMNIYSVEF